MRIHALKTLPEYYEAVRCGYKTFEVRLNDRDFQAGDTLILKEFKPPDTYTGREIETRIIYIMDNPQYCKDGYVILAIDYYPEDSH